MLAGGRIWYRSNPFRIVAINGGTEEEFPPVPHEDDDLARGWKVDGKILSPECLAREWPSSDNFKIFGEFASQFGIRSRDSTPRSAPPPFFSKHLGGRGVQLYRRQLGDPREDLSRA